MLPQGTCRATEGQSETERETDIQRLTETKRDPKKYKESQRQIKTDRQRDRLTPPALSVCLSAYLTHSLLDVELISCLCPSKLRRTFPKLTQSKQSAMD